jgi:hypothetical protein
MNPNICPACKNVNTNESVFCSTCEYPFQGTEKEKSIHIGRFISKKGILVDADDSIRKSQNILLLVIGLNVLYMVFNFDFLINNKIILLLDVLIIISFGVCAFMMKKAPVLFTIIPLIIILALYVLNFIFDPRSILNGILLKIIIVGTLVYSVLLHVKSKKFKEKYNH